MNYRAMTDHELEDLNWKCVKEYNAIGEVGFFKGGAKRARKAQLDRIVAEINYEKTRRKQYGR